MLTRWQAYEDFFKRILLERRTLRSRFAMYLVTLFGILTSAVMVLLILSGFLNPLDHDLEKFMDYELNNRRQELKRQMDNLAAHGINYSQQLSEAILCTMEQHNLSLQQLNGQPHIFKPTPMILSMMPWKKHPAVAPFICSVPVLAHKNRVRS